MSWEVKRVLSLPQEIQVGVYNKENLTEVNRQLVNVTIGQELVFDITNSEWLVLTLLVSLLVIVVLILREKYK